ncbi:MAG: phosphoenolpyruvate carboxylase, partial [Calditrichaeota bacterium]
YLNDLDDFINKVKIFRTQFASLDIRQNHTVHLKIITETLRQKKIIKTDLSELKPSKLIDILLNANYVLEPELFDDSLIQDTIRNIKQLKTIQAKNGEHGCNRYIVSNSEDIFSVLFVFALFRWCGMDTKEIKFDIIPLFESMSGMTNAKDIMLDLLRLPAYRAHIKQRKETQTMMLGFSDGTKDGGYLKANWAIFRTKEELSTVCEMYGVKAIFFDGRGGPPARGGGKTHRFYAAQSEKIANHAIQLTIQGQTITSKFGTIEHFTHNSEQLLTAGLAHKLTSGNNTISAKQRSLIEELAERSFEKYTSLKNHPKFIPYLENKSTLKYYSRTNIGSRPSKRGNKDGLDLKDLRAIPFVGSWSQLKQNVPGYYGIGTAIADMIKKGMLEQLKQLFAEVPFFKALILNSMMSLSKCYFELTAYITKDPEYKEFWNLLFDEYKLAKDMVLLISGYERLMQEEPISRNSIQIRERIVLPLLVIQQYALQKIEKKSKKSELFEKMVKRSLYGNINASRNAA